MRRHEFIAGLGGAVAWPVTALGQQPVMPVVGILQAGSAASSAGYIDAFRDAMRQLGYTEGRNVRFEYRFADGVIELLPYVAGELIALNPSIIVSGPLSANQAAQKATNAIPIVMGTGADRPYGAAVIARPRRRSHRMKPKA